MDIGNALAEGFLVFSFLAFRDDNKFKYNHLLLFLAILADLKMIQFWSLNYVCQV